MASNLAKWDPSIQSVVVTDPASPVHNNPVRVGTTTGVAITDMSTEGNNTGFTTVDFGYRNWNLSVKGVNDAGNVAVVAGDRLYRVDGDTPTLSKKSSGYFFGVARGAVGSGLTATIEVEHHPSAGGGPALVGASNLAANLAKGYIALPLAGIRLLSANDIANLAAIGGSLAKDSVPIFERINAATDKGERVRWVASGVTEVILGQFAYPPDLDDTANLSINILAKMGGATDVPTVALSYFEGIGGANFGGATAAMSNVLTQKSVIVTAANLGAYPNMASVSLTPGAHGTDTFELYGAWIEYARRS